MIKAKKVFFVGIGGIGVSAMARLLSSQGKIVRGSDLADSELIHELRSEGINVFIGNQAESLPDNTELVVYSVAVPLDHPVLEKARKLGIPALSYPEALGELTRGYKVIAIAGTNGKTTTTAMVGEVLVKAGLDPTVIVGSKVSSWRANFRRGAGEWLVLEADEYRRAFLNYHYDIGVILNVSGDHFDYFKNEEDLKAAFAEFAAQVKPRGVLIENQAQSEYQFSINDPIVKKLDLKVPGEFNLENAAAAAAVCRAVGVGEEEIVAGLNGFLGTWRRFERIGSVSGVKVISDYAHHPEAIAVTLKTLYDEYPKKRVLAVFQPHQRSRTKVLFPDFVKSFCESPIEHFIITEIFAVAGRDLVETEISSQDLVKEIVKCGKEVTYAADLNECEQQVRKRLKEFDVIMFMGAGDVYKLANKLINND